MTDNTAMAAHFSKADLLRVVKIAHAAGDAIMAIYAQEDFAVTQKRDESPVTAADLAAHKVILAQLTEQFAGIPVMSEEAADIAWDERQHWQTYWLIDPLDGTKEFIKRNGEFTVNIALIHQGVAIAGVVYAPVLNTVYFGAKHLGAWRQDGQQELVLQGCNPPREVPIVVGSRSHLSPDVAEYLKDFGQHEMLSVGSSLKFCMLAEGKADLYPRLGPTSEWDTAAAQAVLESAGGKVVCYDSGLPLTYNQKPDILNPYFIATAPGWAE
ncbi:3'(2'),5'-bisphosphate nucleotidase CysQ [Shewanella sp. GD04112]|uniref:3'(2'),5'-bisphosphate nucleotidase CysQ n=1 Tax=Shewanella sp. GD04112 TaxID=2975434 RepID=UPI00244ADBD7|nr:3'(2'),5'-bisphosphate nucleotidase CysQ [Shewanella sp. GD04112]MDH0449387.1 3'(2'),5'-bisphosphate nucleotidase CysQ [Shewanella sp. GD04112]